jgi:hypothetical protein
MTTSPPERLLLRNLPLVSRLVLAAFLLSVGVGYFSALVQLHFQAAEPGKMLPDKERASEIYHGNAKVMSQLERLLTADERKPFNGSGSMRAAFTKKSPGWKFAIVTKAKELKLDPAKKENLIEAEKKLRSERYGEIQVLLDWIRHGLDHKAYGIEGKEEEAGYVLPARLANQPITKKYVLQDSKPVKIDIYMILKDRCVKCHDSTKSGPEAAAPLEEYEQILGYAEVETVGGGMSLRKLAQTTHVHLLGFAMLYGMTGLIFSLTDWWGWVRIILAPLPLVAQVIEICVGWWGGRAYQPLAEAVPLFGILVATGVFLQIVLSLINMFNWKGKIIVVILLLAGAAGVGALYMYVMDPYLENEKTGAVREPMGQ